MSLSSELLLDPTYLSNEIAGADEKPHFYEAATVEVPVYIRKIGAPTTVDDVVRSTVKIDFVKQGRNVTAKLRRWPIPSPPNTALAGGNNIWTTIDPLREHYPQLAGPTGHIPRRFLPFVDTSDVYNADLEKRTYRWQDDALLLGTTNFTVNTYEYGVGSTSVSERSGKLAIVTGNLPQPSTGVINVNFAPDTYGTFTLAPLQIQPEGVTVPPGLLPGVDRSWYFLTPGSGLSSDTVLSWQTESACNNIPEGWATAERENYFDVDFPCPVSYVAP